MLSGVSGKHGNQPASELLADDAPRKARVAARPWTTRGERPALNTAVG